MDISSNQLKNQIEEVANLSINSDDGVEKSKTGKVITCTYCALTFRTRSDLRQHCQTESHQNVILSDEGIYYNSLFIMIMLFNYVFPFLIVNQAETGNVGHHQEVTQLTPTHYVKVSWKTTHATTETSALKLTAMKNYWSGKNGSNTAKNECYELVKKNCLGKATLSNF